MTKDLKLETATCSKVLPHESHTWYTEEGFAYHCNGLLNVETLACLHSAEHNRGGWAHEHMHRALRDAGVEESVHWINPEDYQPRAHMEGDASQQVHLDKIAKHHLNDEPDPDVPRAKMPFRFDLMDGPAMYEMAQVLYEGEQKYGIDNWRRIPIENHLNHLIGHAYAWLSGDRSVPHLSHIMCNALFAQAKDLRPDYLGEAENAGTSSNPS